MELYFSPLACSLSSRIALTEARAEVDFIRVDDKRLPDGRDYREVNPLGLVPALRTDDGKTLTENAAVLEYIAERYPKAALAPSDREDRAELRRWLSFIGSELHAALFAVLFDKNSSDEVKRYALERGASRLRHVDAHLTGRAYLLDQFSVADAYLFTVLNWTLATPVKLADYPALAAYRTALLDRPSVAAAFQVELPLYQESIKRKSI